MLLTVIPCGASSSASAFVSPISAGLDAFEAGADRTDEGARARAGSHLVERGVDCRAVGDVDLRADRVGSGLAQALGGLQDRVALQVEEADAVASRRQMPGDRQPHPRCGSGDHGDPTHRDACLPCLDARDYARPTRPFATTLSDIEN